MSLSINAPSQITDQSFPVEVTISGASSGQNYIRVDLYKDQTSNYFGETFNGSAWEDGSDGQMYFPILIASSQAQVTVDARLGNPSRSKYLGSGSYKLKVRRYTASGAVAGSDTVTPLDVHINYSPPTSTSEPTKVPAPTKVLTPSKTPTPTKSSLTAKLEAISVGPTYGKSVLLSKDSLPDEDDRMYPTAVLGENDKVIKKASPESIVSGENEASNIDYLPIILLLAGGAFVAICAIIMYRNWRKI